MEITGEKERPIRRKQRMIRSEAILQEKKSKTERLKKTQKRNSGKNDEKRCKKRLDNGIDEESDSE